MLLMRISEILFCASAIDHSNQCSFSYYRIAYVCQTIRIQNRSYNLWFDPPVDYNSLYLCIDLFCISVAVVVVQFIRCRCMSVSGVGLLHSITMTFTTLTAEAIMMTATAFISAELSNCCFEKFSPINTNIIVTQTFIDE